MAAAFIRLPLLRRHAAIVTLLPAYFGAAMRLRHARRVIFAPALIFRCWRHYAVDDATPCHTLI